MNQGLYFGRWSLYTLNKGVGEIFGELVAKPANKAGLIFLLKKLQVKEVNKTPMKL